MKRVAFAVGALALSFMASAPARADFAVVKFMDTGACRAWYDHTAHPWGTVQVLWDSLPTWDAAQTAGAFAMAHHWCKAWIK